MTVGGRPGRDRPIRVLHAVHDVGGNPAALAAAERTLGLDSTAVTLRQSRFAFPADEVLCDASAGELAQERARWRLLRRVGEFDIVHFNFGQSIFPTWTGWRAPRSPLQVVRDVYKRVLWQRDLPLLRARRTPIFVTFQGDDARQGDHLRAHYEVEPTGEVDETYYRAAADRAKRRAIIRFDRYADGIFALNPDLLGVLPDRARFLPYASVDVRQWDPAPSIDDSGPPVVLHAPTHRGVKGTRHVIEAVRALEAEGVPIDFRLVENLAHHDARKLYERADLLVDQLLLGWYGGLAVELMAMAKPVVAYIRPEDLRRLPEAMVADLPVISAEPRSIVEVLRTAITGPRADLRDRGLRSRAYVERWHDPLKVAATTKRAYEAALGV